MKGKTISKVISKMLFLSSGNFSSKLLQVFASFFLEKGEKWQKSRALFIVAQIGKLSAQLCTIIKLKSYLCEDDGRVGAADPVALNGLLCMGTPLTVARFLSMSCVFEKLLLCLVVDIFAFK